VCQTAPLLSIRPGLSYTVFVVRARESPGPWKAANMNEAKPDAMNHLPAALSEEKIPEEVALEIRKLAHDLSNALEIIVQTSYLLGTVDLKEPATDWLHMLDGGVQKALDINLALRNYIKKNTAH
jgi:hypothetical protein